MKRRKTVKPRNRLLVALGAALALVPILMWSNGFLGKREHEDYLRMGLGRNLELRSELPNECLRFVRRGIDGKTVMSLPEQCNGDSGYLKFHPGTENLARRVVYFKRTDRVRFTADFATDGLQVVRGFELRPDGSKLWEAAANESGTIVTTTYWWNGNVFSVEKRDVGATSVDTTYYHASGGRWMHYVGKRGVHFINAVAGENGLKLIEAWRDDGTQIFSVIMGEDQKSATRLFFRDDGTLHTRQQHRWHTYHSPEGSSSGLALVQIDLYGATGRTLERELFIDPDVYGLRRMTVHNADGTRSELKLIPGGEITDVKRLSADGHVLEEVAVPAGKREKYEFDYKLTDGPKDPDMLKAWADQEKLRFPTAVVN
jgi:hypothetical protein